MGQLVPGQVMTHSRAPGFLSGSSNYSYSPLVIQTAIAYNRSADSVQAVNVAHGEDKTGLTKVGAWVAMLTHTAVPNIRKK